jgi:hypothetical protein
MATQAEVENAARRVLKEEGGEVKLRLVEPLDNNQSEVWDINLICPRCDNAAISVLADVNVVSVPEEVRRRVREHLTTHA